MEHHSCLQSISHLFLATRYFNVNSELTHSDVADSHASEWENVGAEKEKQVVAANYRFTKKYLHKMMKILHIVNTGLSRQTIGKYENARVDDFSVHLTGNRYFVDNNSVEESIISPIWPFYLVERGEYCSWESEEGSNCPNERYSHQQSLVRLARSQWSNYGLVMNPLISQWRHIFYIN